MRNRRGTWSAAAITAGLAYLVWRAASTISGVPAALAWPALALEIAAWVVMSATLLTLGRDTRLDATHPVLGARADVIIRVDGQALSQVLASLAGARHAEGVASVTVMLFADRPDVVEAVHERSVALVAADPRADPAGFTAALTVGSAPYLAILDAGDVPTSGFITAMARVAGDGYTAAVVGLVDNRSVDSAEHDLRGRHERRFDREVLIPSGSPAATIQGSGTLLRRWAVDHVGVPRGSRRGVEMKLSGRLRAAGFHVVAPTGPVVVWACSPNAAMAVRSMRRRDAAGALETLRSGDGPLRARGLRWRDRMALFAALGRPLAGLYRAAFLTLLLACLVAGRLPMSIGLGELAACWLPYALLKVLAVHTAADGRLTYGEPSRWSLGTMGAALAALAGPGRTPIGAGYGVPRHGGRMAVTANRTIIVALALFAVVIPVVAISDRFTAWLPVMSPTDRAVLLAVTVWSIVMMLEVLRCLAGSTQLRRSTRISASQMGRIDDFRALFLDLTPYGAGALVDGAGFAEPLYAGDEVPFGFELPTPIGTTARVVGSAVVRSTREAPEGYLCGLEFTTLDFMSSDALYEYCEVMHASGSPADDPALPERGRPMPARTPSGSGSPRRLAVRLSAIAVLIGVCIATAPPLTSSAAASSGATTGAAPASMGEQIFLIAVFAMALATIARVVAGPRLQRVRPGLFDR